MFVDVTMIGVVVMDGSKIVHLVEKRYCDSDIVGQFIFMEDTHTTCLLFKKFIRSVMGLGKSSWMEIRNCGYVVECISRLQSFPAPKNRIASKNSTPVHIR